MELENTNVYDAINEDKKGLNYIADFLLREILLSTHVNDRWGPDVETITSIEWRRISEVLMADLEVYIQKSDDNGNKTELTRNVYSTLTKAQFNDPFRFLLQDNRIAILYTQEQAKRAGYNIKETQRSSEYNSEKKREVSDQKFDEQSKKYEDCIEMLEMSLEKLIHKDVKKSRWYEEMKNACSNPSVSNWEELKKNANAELKELIQKKSISSGKSEKCDICKSKTPTDELHKISCGHYIDMNCLLK